MATFKCFQEITIVNPDGEPICQGTDTEFDFLLDVEYIDLSLYGGDTHTYVTSNENIIEAFEVLGITVKVEGCRIIFLEDVDCEGECTNVPIQETCFIDINNNGNRVCHHGEWFFFLFNSIDLSPFGGPEYYYITNTDEIIEGINMYLTETTSEYTPYAELQGCTLKLHFFTGECENIQANQDPTITIIDGCTDGEFDYTVFNAVDLSFYGGSDSTPVSSNQDVIDAFLALEIEVEIEGCNIRLVEWQDPFEDVPMCPIQVITLEDCDIFPYEIDFSPVFNGDKYVINNFTDLENAFESEEIEFTRNGCDISILSPVCLNINSLPIRPLFPPTANPDIIPNCIVLDSTYTLPIIGNDTNISGLPFNLMSINGVDVFTNNTYEVVPGIFITINPDGTIDINSTITGNFNIPYTIVNSDGLTSTSYIEFCVSDQPVANDDLIILECGESNCFNALENDIFVDPISVVSINGFNSFPVVLVPGVLEVTTDGTEICFNLLQFGFNTAGQITYTVTNGVNEDTAIIQYTIDQTSCNPCLVTSPEMVYNTTDAFCGQQGQVCITLNSGYPPYTVVVDGISKQTFSQTCFELNEGSYTIDVTDSEGCSLNENFQILGDNELTCFTTNGNVTNCGVSDGNITVIESGGTSPYQYSINGNPFQSSNIFLGLMTGTFITTVRDANGCETQCTTTITGPNTPLIEGYIVGLLDCATSTYSVSIQASGVEYSLDMVNWQSSNILNIASGMSTVYVRDINTLNCISSIAVDIPQIIYGCTDSNTPTFNPLANCDDGSCVNCTPPLLYNTVIGDCECPSGTCEYTLPNGTVICMPTCDPSIDGSCANPPTVTCPDGTIATNCTDCYCFDVFFVLDVSGSMNSNGGLVAMKDAMTTITNYLATNYSGAFNFNITTFNTTGNVVLSCTNVTSSTANGINTVINNLIAGGSTSMSAGITTSNMSFNSCSSCDYQLMIILGDGAVNSNASSQASNFLTLGGDQVTTISLGSGANVTAMETISAVDGIEDNYVASNDNLTDIFTNILDGLCDTQCVELDNNPGCFVCSPCIGDQTWDQSTNTCI